MKKLVILSIPFIFSTAMAAPIDQYIDLGKAFLGNVSVGGQQVEILKTCAELKQEKRKIEEELPLQKRKLQDIKYAIGDYNASSLFIKLVYKSEYDSMKFEGHALNIAIKTMEKRATEINADFESRCVCYNEVTENFGIVEQIYNKYQGESLDIYNFYFSEQEKTVIYQTNNMQDGNRYLVEYIPETCDINRIENI